MSSVIGERPGLEERVAAVRAFNRFYTTVIGLLRSGLLDTPYSLAESRVVFELAQRPTTELADLRRALEIDAGHLSRIVSALEAAGLVSRSRSERDGRRQLLELTEAGRDAFHDLDRRSAEQVRTLLTRLGEAQQERLVGAMEMVRTLLGGAPERERDLMVLRQPEPGELGWIVSRHGALYAEEYGWDRDFEALVARVVSDYMASSDLDRERAWIAEQGGRPVGCVLCTKKSERVAQLRLLLVEPRARGQGIGSRLVEEVVRFAERSGYERLTLWTNDVLADARRIYERAGFALDGEEAHHSFGAELVAQTWSRDL